MAGPIIAAALRRIRTIQCPFCGQKKAVSRERVTFRVCPRCGKRYPDPGDKATARKRPG
jgi:ribosomal protein L37AE/L43A